MKPRDMSQRRDERVIEQQEGGRFTGRQELLPSSFSEE